MAASRVRGRVLGFAFLLAVVTYLDRICISAAAPYIMEDLHLTRPPDERRVQRLHARLLAVRGAVGLARRRQGPAPRPDAHRAVVVGVHDADRRSRAASSRSSRSASCSAPARRAPSRTSRGASRAGFPMRERGRANGVHVPRIARRRHAVGADRAADRRALGLAHELRALRRASASSWAAAWFAWYRDRPEEHPSVNARGARVDPAGRRAGGRARRRARPGARCCAAGTCTRSARCTSPSATACTSISRGCRRT